jgi:hypothetical protein
MTERKPTARIAAFKGSGIRRVFEAARTLERSVVTITHMEIGRPDFDMELAEYLLREAHLAAVPGSEFGEPGHLRFSYAAQYEAIADGMARMTKALAALPGRRA